VKRVKNEVHLPCPSQILLKKARKIISMATPANNPIIMANVFSPLLSDLPEEESQKRNK
jgi:hypothetical protein